MPMVLKGSGGRPLFFLEKPKAVLFVMPGCQVALLLYISSGWLNSNRWKIEHFTSIMEFALVICRRPNNEIERRRFASHRPWWPPSSSLLSLSFLRIQFPTSSQLATNLSNPLDILSPWRNMCPKVAAMIVLSRNQQVADQLYLHRLLDPDDPELCRCASPRTTGTSV